MGRRWAETSSAARDVMAEADSIIGSRFGAPLSKICFDGPEAVLNRTDVAQPALFAVGVACFRALWPDGAPVSIGAAAGLSLGEYTALHLAGAFSFADGLELVALRGRAMQEAADSMPGGMVALVGADEAQAHTVCERAARGEVLVAANLNAPGQVVISGSAAACDRAAQVASEMGFRAAKLPVAGAFHSPLMAPAAERLKQALSGVAFSTLRCPVLSNVTARPHDAGTGAAESIRARLVDQLVRPVLWSDGCAWLARQGLGELHELAPGKVLAGLMRRIDRSVKVVSHDEPVSP